MNRPPSTTPTLKPENIPEELPLLSRPDTTGPAGRGTGKTCVTAQMIYDLAQLSARGLDALR